MTVKVAICFFGITRGVSTTYRNIEANIYSSIAALNFEHKVFAHFFEQTRVENNRSGEKGTIDPNDAYLLSPDDIYFEPPELFLADSTYKNVIKFGDFWEDENKSIKNLYHQLYSMASVTDKCLKWQPDIVLFLRPDLHYHDDFRTIIEQASKRIHKNSLALPNWQHCGGYNDRFAVVTGEEAIVAYGKRFNKMLKFCEETNSPIHSERLVKYSTSAFDVSFIPLRASRVRSDGSEVEELFLHYKTMLFSRWLENVSSVSQHYRRKIVWLYQKLRFGDPYKGLD
ncbi:hypothetical protein C7Y69_02320 [Alteromonas sp. KS69]|jgi:hypothetical protein|uniref:hypothetical protein n=1 Tax=Alteromonas sp. KS69 TaxID=2109917 RepID=UPI000F887CD8|nr:hypothetical protein [Alteromonas sp. KS69]RUP83386.1 hypothetical protein C7Y69_02320 [Alteromonas sp. KS69]|tara:strand:- start:8781 stop:9632 length:852 start_codon:yes stop_codon:yes gene_type:complete